jgi:xanthine dehydrogenase accessory factor
MELWAFIKEKMLLGQALILLYVLDSEGSSPGRKGFKMAVAEDDTFIGTIGGGIMEHKLVEKAKAILRAGEKKVLLLRQHHDKEHTKDRSGMICSGSQLNAFIPLSGSELQIIADLDASEKLNIQLSPNGIAVTELPAKGLEYKDDDNWVYTEPIKCQPVIHIIGGGHIGLALSELMSFLGFYIKLYDDRSDLNTIVANSFADEKYFVNYDDIAGYFRQAEDDYIVIMTIGYRTDKLVLKQLAGQRYQYLGLLGSDHKIKTLFEELSNEGFPADVLNKIHTPIGLNIFSKTAKEIAVSIAAEIIKEKNRGLPGGRTSAG